MLTNAGQSASDRVRRQRDHSFTEKVMDLRHIANLPGTRGLHLDGLDCLLASDYGAPTAISRVANGRFMIGPDYPILGDCAGMLLAAKRMEECKVLLSQRGKSEAAVLHFLKAFKHSVFALSMLEGCKPRLLKAVQELERANIFLGETWATYVGWVARTVLTGWKEVDFPSNDSQLRLVTDLRRTNFFPFMVDTAELSADDMRWLSCAGQFRVYWALVKGSQTGNQRRGLSGQKDKTAEKSEITGMGRGMAAGRIDAVFDVMQQLEPKHPVTLQALMMLQDCPESRHQDQFHPETLMQLGYHHALDDLFDPAACIQHLLFCMYWELQDIGPRPRHHTRQRVTEASLEVLSKREMLMEEHFDDGTCVWDVVRNQLVAPMLLLGHTFDLEYILDEPSFLFFIEEEYKHLRQQSAQGNLAQAATQPRLLAEDSAWSISSRKAESNEVTAEDRCERCLKKTRKHDMLACARCHQVKYCSRECMKRDATQHAKPCKRFLMKQKHGDQTADARS